MTRRTDPMVTGWATVAVVVVLLALSGLAALLDQRLLNGVSVWSKPIKFNLSFALHLSTLMLFISLLRADIRRSPLLRWTVGFTSAAVVAELLYIFVQAARGRASHFNVETHWENLAYYALMGGAAAVVMAGTLVIGILVWRGARDCIGPGLRTGAALGAIVGTVATLVTAGAMASGAVTPSGHWVGGDLTDATGLPVLGWSTTGGDLRVAHFFATHLVQALPVAGWLADRIAHRAARVSVWLAMLAGLVVVWVTFDQALAGKPFPGGLTDGSPPAPGHAAI